MHPPLYRDHPDCQDIIEQFSQCHKENKLGKWFGACNQAKYALDACFKEEKERKRKENSAKAKIRRESYERALAEIENKK